MLLGWLWLGFGACSTVESMSTIAAVETDLEAITVLGLKNVAPYEYAAASYYFEEAERQQSYAQYRRAINYANRASLCIQAARSIARKHDSVDSQSCVPERYRNVTRARRSAKSLPAT